MIYSKSLPPGQEVPSTVKEGQAVKFPMILHKVATSPGGTKGKVSAHVRGIKSCGDIETDAVPIVGARA